MCSVECLHYRLVVDIVFWTCNILELSGRKKWVGSSLSKKWGVRPPVPPKVTPLFVLLCII